MCHTIWLAQFLTSPFWEFQARGNPIYMMSIWRFLLVSDFAVKICPTTIQHNLENLIAQLMLRSAWASYFVFSWEREERSFCEVKIDFITVNPKKTIEKQLSIKNTPHHHHPAITIKESRCSPTHIWRWLNDEHIQFVNYSTSWFPLGNLRSNLWWCSGLHWHHSWHSLSIQKKALFMKWQRI